MKYLLKPYLMVREFGAFPDPIPVVVKEYPVVSGMPVVEVEGTEDDVRLAVINLQRAHGLDYYASTPMPHYTWKAEIVQSEPN